MKIHKFLKLTLILTSIFLTGCGIKLDSQAVDANEYLKDGFSPKK
jgi:hypothetical protein